MSFHRYLDSHFCASFHAFKRSSSPQTVHTLGLAILFTIWSLAMVAWLLRLLAGFCRQIQLPGHTTPAERAYACVEVIAKQTALGTAGRLMLLMLPWPFYQVCVDMREVSYWWLVPAWRPRVGRDVGTAAHKHTCKRHEDTRGTRTILCANSVRSCMRCDVRQCHHACDVRQYHHACARVLLCAACCRRSL